MRRYALAIEQIRPVIRIAHQPIGLLNIPRRAIVDFEIVLIIRGEARFVSPDGSASMPAGEMVLIPPFVEHAFRSHASVEHIAVHFDLSPAVPGTQAAARSGAYRVELSQGQSLPTCRPMTLTQMSRQALERVVESFADGTAVSALECSSLLAGVLAGLLKADASRAVDQPHRLRLLRVLNYINTHLANPLDADLLAAKADLSPSRLRAVFVERMGVSPHQYVLQRRIALARQLLADDRHSIKEIARLTGFADEFHFSKAFRKFDGLPPSVYRTQAQASRF